MSIKASAALVLTTSLLVGCGYFKDQGYEFEEVKEESGKTYTGHAYVDGRQVQWVYDDETIGTINARYDSCMLGGPNRAFCSEEWEIKGEAPFTNGMFFVRAEENGDLTFIDGQTKDTSTIKKAASRFKFR